MGITQALNDLVVGESDPGDRIDRHDARHRALSVITQFPGKPVASKRRGRHRNSSAIGEAESYCRSGVRIIRLRGRVSTRVSDRASGRWPVVCDASQCHEPVTHSEPGEPQPLFFGPQIDFLCSQLVLKLTFEVIEKVVPAHATTLTSATDADDRLSTAPPRGHGAIATVLV